MTLARQGNNSGNPNSMAQPKEGISVSRQVLRPRLPIVRVRQDQSRKGQTPGSFIFIDDEQELAQLRGTPVAMQEGRTMFPTPFKNGEPPRCWSNDGAQAARGAEFVGRWCDECPFLLDGCNPNWQIVFRLLPEHEGAEPKDIMLQVGVGMEQAVAALIQADVFRERQVILGTRKVHTKSGAWYTLTLDDDMPLLSVKEREAIELDFRKLYLPGMQMRAVQPAEMEDPGNATMPPQLGQDIDDMYPQGHVAERIVPPMPVGVAPPGVDPRTGEIIVDQHPGEMPDDDYDDGPPPLDLEDDYDDSDDLPF